MCTQCKELEAKTTNNEDGLKCMSVVFKPLKQN